jgi:hypothetical protein
MIGEALPSPQQARLSAAGVPSTGLLLRDPY